jgi:hypothetical protein
MSPLDPVKLAPVEHRVTFLGKDPVGYHQYRIRCECGWTEKAQDEWQGKNRDIEGLRTTLMLRWERHVYTPEMRVMLHELESPDCDVCRRGF